MFHLDNARWHARQCRLEASRYMIEAEDYHREAAQEALEAFAGKRYRYLTIDELDAFITMAFDALACHDARALG